MSTPPVDRPLDGVDLLLTRDPARAATTVSRLSALGARVDARSAIAFENPRDPAPAEAAARRLDTYRWLVFTSPNGVRFFGERVRAGGDDLPAGRRGVVAIGVGTARALEGARMPADVVAADADSEGLARALLARVRPSERVLIVRPELGGDRVPNVLRDAGAEVDAVAFYRTVASAQAGEIAECVAEGVYDVIVFTSPSNLRFLLREGGSRGVPIESGIDAARRVAMGKTTAAALGREGFAAHAVASAPDDDGIVEAVIRSVS